MISTGNCFSSQNSKQNEADKVGISDFELLQQLGAGADGKVFLVKKLNGPDQDKLYAMKVLKKKRVCGSELMLQHTKAEREALEDIKGTPFFVNLHYAFQTDTKLHLVLDYVNGGELFTHLDIEGPFPENRAKFYIAELILALEYLHERGIIYRDIKTENILLDSEGHVILTDFGLCKKFSPDEKDQRAYSYCGTLEYMAPEVMSYERIAYNYVADYWSIGVLLFEFLTGKCPYYVKSKKRNRQTYLKKLKEKLVLPKNISKSARDLLRKLLVKDPSKRLGYQNGIVELKNHRFFMDINWSDLAEKKIEPPLKPRILHSLDTSNFCEEFTSQLPIYSPGKRPASGKIHVEGYSYIDPSLVFSKDVSVDGTFGMFPEQQALNLVSADNFSDSPFYKNYEIDYNKGELGRGAFSVCRVCIDQRTKLEYAVKIIDKKFDCSREIEFLQACQGHPNIVKLQEVLHDKDNTYIIMELLRGGELLDKIEEKIQFTEEEARKLFQQIVSAVNFMHEKNIVHRDLKPENLVFEDSSDDALIKIVDFGFARIKPSENEKMMSPCFTMKYAAPEVLNSTLSNSSNERGLADKPGYNEACDLWSLGVILHVMMSGSTPFSTNGKAINAEAAIQRIQEGEFSLTDELWDDVSEEAKDILQGLLTVDPERRLTMEQLCAKDWIRASWEDLEANNLQVATDASNSVSATTEESPMDFETPTREATTQDFCLRDVSASLLSQRQKRKRKSTDQNSSTFSNSDDIASSQTTNSSPQSLDMEVFHVSSNNESLMLGYNIDNCCYNQ